jgi:hypothetical protein
MKFDLGELGALHPAPLPIKLELHEPLAVLPAPTPIKLERLVPIAQFPAPLPTKLELIDEVARQPAPTPIKLEQVEPVALKPALTPTKKLFACVELSGKFPNLIPLVANVCVPVNVLLALRAAYALSDKYLLTLLSGARTVTPF